MRVTIHLDHKPLLKGEARMIDGSVMLVDRGRTIIDAENPVSCLLDCADICQLGQSGKLELKVFCGGNRPARLLARKAFGEMQILVELADGSCSDVHETRIADLLPEDLPARIHG